MKPVIAVSAQTAISDSKHYGEQRLTSLYDLYVNAITAAGGLPVVLAHGDPADAVAFAAKIIKEQLTIFINFEELAEAPLLHVDEPEPLNPNLFKSVDELELESEQALELELELDPDGPVVESRGTDRDRPIDPAMTGTGRLE